MTYFDDNGKEYNHDIYPAPSLCILCKKRDNPKEQVACNLTRMDQLGEKILFASLMKSNLDFSYPFN